MESGNNESILIAIITITILFFLFSVFIVSYFLIYRRNQKRYQERMVLFQKEFERQKLESQVELQEMTYKHIAKELHDNIGQLMGTTKMLISVVDRQSEEQGGILAEADQTLSKAIQEIRQLSRSLDNEWLEQFELCENLQNEMSRINSSGRVNVDLFCSRDIALDKPSQIILFRVIQEGIQNALRHANPSNIEVRVEDKESVTVEVKNNGLPLPDHFFGMGTNNMRKRVEVLGGDIEWVSDASYTVVRIRIPQKSRHEN
jgi:signal transduction histidine kinase